VVIFRVPQRIQRGDIHFSERGISEWGLPGRVHSKRGLSKRGPSISVQRGDFNRGDIQRGDFQRGERGLSGG
jgi:hypothetical protein